MNVLYAGYSNPVSISVPGVPANKIAARITKGEGSIKSDGKIEIIKKYRGKAKAVRLKYTDEQLENVENIDFSGK